ncbi:MAG: cytochrome c biogenesis protein DipZ [Patescibacteria group bacterium]
MLTLLVLAFLSGVITIFAPCIWPLLPILLSASAMTGKRRPAGIVLGIITSFTLFTLFLSYLLHILPIPPDLFRNGAAFIIILLGLSLAVPYLSKRLEGAVSGFIGKFGSTLTKKQGEGFWGGYVTGFFLGLLWSPCAGPVLAAVATFAATRAVTIEVFGITLAFGLGVGVPLFILATLGQRVFIKSRKLSPYTGRIQQIFGVIMILAALAIFLGYDKSLQTKILDALPSYSKFLLFFEDSPLIQEKIHELNNTENSRTTPKQETSNLKSYGPAPEFTQIEKWLNTQSDLKMEDLRGKVVLIDFWTYSCINCIRTLPFVTGWYEKYKDSGFVVVGVHTPEFAFERETKNVEDAIKRYRIHYPVAQDNEYGTWQAYQNRYWPAHYLIDAKGIIREVHFGEGKYDETERAIQDLLKEAGAQSVERELLDMPEERGSLSQTQETYVGYGRLEHFASTELIQRDQEASYTFPKKLPLHTFALSGKWKIEEERAVSGESAKLQLQFSGKKVFLVLSPGASGNALVNVLLDGASVPIQSAGTDVKEGKVMVTGERLYELIHLSGSEIHTLELQFEDSGTGVYAFTFG